MNKFKQFVNCSKLNGRSLLLMSGKDIFKILQGITTNDVIKNLQMSEIQAQYNLFLNTQGRIVSDAILVKPLVYSEEGTWIYKDDELFLDVDIEQKSTLTKHIKQFLIRKKISIEDISDQLTQNVIYHNNLRSEEQLGYPINQDSEGQCDVGDYKHTVYVDPRSPLLGLRVITPNDSMSTTSDIMKKSEDHYQQFRFSKGILEGKEVENTIPFTVNMDFNNAISLTKGCYLGQELTARTYHTGVIRRRCLPFKVINNKGELTGDIIQDENKTVGKLLFVKGQFGVGLFTYLEDDCMGKDLTIGKELTIRVLSNEILEEQIQGYKEMLKQRG